MSTKQWLFNVSVVIVGGLVVAGIIGYLFKDKFDEVSANPLSLFTK